MPAELTARHAEIEGQRLELPRLERGIGVELGCGPYRQLTGYEGHELLLAGERMDHDFKLLRVERKSLEMESGGEKRVEPFNIRD